MLGNNIEEQTFYSLACSVPYVYIAHTRMGRPIHIWDVPYAYGPISCPIHVWEPHMSMHA